MENLSQNQKQKIFELIKKALNESNNNQNEAIDILRELSIDISEIIGLQWNLTEYIANDCQERI